MALTFHDNALSAADFKALRDACGWGDISLDLADRALTRALCVITVCQNDRPIGCVRVIGDGALNYYIQDLIVDPSYRGQDLGADLMRRAIDYIYREAAPGATIGLMTVAGLEPFYTRFGFQTRPGGELGAGMTHVIPVSA